MMYGQFYVVDLYNTTHRYIRSITFCCKSEANEFATKWFRSTGGKARIHKFIQGGNYNETQLQH